MPFFFRSARASLSVNVGGGGATGCGGGSGGCGNDDVIGCVNDDVTIEG